ncbi:MAG: type 1 glutamine amidotransferase [Gammaproteobacteria bacterium]|nr:type 1 glutamine amidotransferase [Gammaproteobacteria bacterium]MBU1491143.1 type 1 glutamine amidotransferase [Gammaproteobacteria bacterium]MBU2065907.1 type 1 glutamine amidotransferase [Gammaproteobacteria bacterium]MBU2141233.1 type 1 glutamine amidotransferase [Gammaproteobacteria bacterium]MBU2215821.1 type 1 glutamine amidotransferase [Gammaproteobacteria bacterium]
MSEVLIFTHVAYCPPGHLGQVLRQRGIAYREVRVDQGELAAVDLSRARAVAIMGGPMSVNDELPWLADEDAALRDLLARGVPLLGHCLGGQLLAKALGAPVQRMPYTESGWQPLTRSAGAEYNPWLAHLPESFEMFQWHGDSFAIPEGAQPLLRSPWCDNQAFAWGERVLALQGHPEMTEALIREWLDDWHHLLDEHQPSQQSRAQMLVSLNQRVSALNRVAEGFYLHWLRQAGLICT